MRDLGMGFSEGFLREVLGGDWGRVLGKGF